MPEENQEFQRRLPSVERKISEIKPDDIRVSITGTVIDMQDGFAVVDDGTGKANVAFEKPEALSSVRTSQLVRVFGRVMPMDDGFELRGDVLQDMSRLDMRLKKKVESIKV
jgi:hypothetical protein